MNKLAMRTPNLTDEKYKKLVDLFPNAVTETIDEEGNVIRAIDKDVLMQEISAQVVEGKQERYQFTWPDKKKSVILANTPTTKTLRLDREKSVGRDGTSGKIDSENIYIEGDNLEALKILRETYLGKVKMIYIDPPYNTGNDFIYADDFSQNVDEYKENSGQFDEEGNRLVPNPESNGRFHTDWLNMIYPRLRLAKDLLSDDGVIFISIDHNEIENLMKICNDIFGFSNCIGKLSVINNLKGRSDDKFFATCNEFLLAYAKNRTTLKISGLKLEDEELEKDYDKEDEISPYKLIGFRKSGNGWQRKDRPFMFYPVLFKNNCFSTITNNEYSNIYNSTTNEFDDEFINELTNKYIEKGYTVTWPLTEKGEFGRWRWGRETFYQQKDLNLEYNNTGTLCTKMRATLEDGSIRTKSAKTLWYKPEYDSGSSSRVLQNLFNTTKNYFENPKSIVLISDILRISTDKDCFIIDFFSGSATTAHAVMKLNAEDGGNRKSIMVQLPERTDINSEVYKAGYKTICDIGEERIRRAGKKIKEETKADIDYGFRCFKVDSSNMMDVYYNPSQYGQMNLDSFMDNIKTDRTSEDLLFQVMLELGILLSSKIEETTIVGKKIFSVADGYLIACFDNDVTDEVITEIAKKHPFYAVFRDSSMESDSVLTNFEQIFETYSPKTQRKVL